jgi:hypothetical protein
MQLNQKQWGERIIHAGYANLRDDRKQQQQQQSDMALHLGSGGSGLMLGGIGMGLPTNNFGMLMACSCCLSFDEFCCFVVACWFVVIFIFISFLICSFAGFPPSNSIYVSNLPSEFDRPALVSMFARFGSILDARPFKKEGSHANTGYACGCSSCLLIFLIFLYLLKSC